MGERTHQSLSPFQGTETPRFNKNLTILDVIREFLQVSAQLSCIPAGGQCPGQGRSQSPEEILGKPRIVCANNSIEFLSSLMFNYYNTEEQKIWPRVDIRVGVDFLAGDCADCPG